MKNNQPVSNHEVCLPEGEFIVSTTDMKGNITSVNRPFLKICGFSEKELIGKNHNVVRHPDMPPAAFQDLWDTVRAGKPWAGVVKNRCKNGDFYWVCANVTPIRKEGETVGYLSVRTRPSSEQIKAAEALYTKVNNGTVSLQPNGLQTIKNYLRKISITTWLGLYTTTMVVLMAVFIYMGAAGISVSVKLSLLGLTVAGLIISGTIFNRYITAPVKQAVKTLGQLAEGNFSDWFLVDRNDEFGEILQYLQSTQIRLGNNINETMLVAAETSRIKQAIDNVDSNIMITDMDNNIIYMNQSLLKMMHKSRDSFNGIINGFNPDDVVGSCASIFYANNEFKQHLGKQITAPVIFETRIGDCNLRITATQVTNENGDHVGTVMIWADCFQEVVIEADLKRIISAALAGDLTQRIDSSGMDGFFDTLSEGINQLLQICSNVIDDTLTVMSALSRGDLSHTIQSEYQGSFGQLKTDINNTIGKLTSVMDQINNSASSVLQGSQEIAQGNNDLSDRTEQQAASLEETASGMEQMTSTIRQNADNARQANQLAASARQQAEQGNQVADDAVTSMNEITASSKKIADIIGVIDEIAFQTNLLALNAAVEAARAGEQGRGFAVVASEVRNLAGRSATAAKEIKDLIKDSVTKVEEGSSLVDASGQTLKEIVQSVKKVSDIIAEIAAASTEQADGIEQVNTAISQMDQVTQQNAALVEQAAAASEAMGQEANNLADMVSFFKTGSHKSGSNLDNTINIQAVQSRRRQAR